MLCWIIINLYWLAPTLSSAILTIFIIRVYYKQKDLQEQSIKINEEQKEIQKQNIKLALFDRRLEVYTKVRQSISLVISNGMCTYDEVNQFNRDCREVNLLFNLDINEYVVEMRKKGLRLAFINKKENTNALLDEQDQLMDWFEAQFEGSANIFDKYLNVNKLGL